MYFAKKGLLTYEGMVQNHRELGFHDEDHLKRKITVILQLAKKSKDTGHDEKLRAEISKFAKILEKTNNPASAGIWMPGGEINYDVLNHLCDQAVEIAGQKVITRKIIDEHLKKTNKNSWAIATWTWVGILYLPVYWTRITKGSFDELFSYLGDIKGQPNAISVEKFRRFYEHSDEVLRELWMSKNVSL